jgi:hypothetical protein
MLLIANDALPVWDLGDSVAYCASVMSAIWKLQGYTHYRQDYPSPETIADTPLDGNSSRQGPAKMLLPEWSYYSLDWRIARQ